MEANTNNKVNYLVKLHNADEAHEVEALKVVLDRESRVMKFYDDNCKQELVAMFNLGTIQSVTRFEGESVVKKEMRKQIIELQEKLENSQLKQMKQKLFIAWIEKELNGLWFNRWFKKVVRSGAKELKEGV